MEGYLPRRRFVFVGTGTTSSTGLADDQSALNFHVQRDGFGMGERRYLLTGIERRIAGEGQRMDWYTPYIGGIQGRM